MTAILRAAILTLVLSVPQISCGAQGGVVASVPDVPWPVTTEGFDEALVEALERGRAGVVARPEDGMAWMSLGMTYEAHSMVEYARECYESGIGHTADDAKCWYRLAVVRSKDGDVEGALAAYERVHALAPGYAPAYRRRGQFLIDVGRPEAAQGAFEAALELDPRDVSSLLGLVEVDLECNRPQAALDRLDGIAQVPRPCVGMRHRLRGLALSRLGRHDEAESDLALGRGARRAGGDPWMRALAEHQVGTSAVLLRASRMIDGGQPAAALELLADLEAKDPDDARVFARKGRALARLGRWSEAAVSLARASDLDRDDMGLALAAASAMLEVHDHDGALQRAARVIEIDPTKPEGHVLRADLLLAAGRLDELRRALEEASGAGVRAADLEVSAGKSAIERKDTVAARAAFQRAIDLDPATADAWGGKALLEIQGGSRDAAVQAVRRVQELAPDHPMRPTLEAALAERTAQGSAAGGGGR